MTDIYIFLNFLSVRTDSILGRVRNKIQALDHWLQVERLSNLVLVHLIWWRQHEWKDLYKGRQTDAFKFLSQCRIHGKITQKCTSAERKAFTLFFFWRDKGMGGGGTWEYENLSVNCSDTGRDDRWRGVSLDRYYRLDTDWRKKDMFKGHCSAEMRSLSLSQQASKMCHSNGVALPFH